MTTSRLKAGTGPMDVRMLGSAEVLRGSVGDVAEEREANRQHRVLKILILLVIVAVFLYWRMFTGNPVHPGWPHFSIPEEMRQYIPSMVLVLLLGTMLMLPLVMAGKSPHTLYRPSEIPTTFDDVLGLGIVKDEVIRTLNLR